MNMKVTLHLNLKMEYVEKESEVWTVVSYATDHFVHFALVDPHLWKSCSSTHLASPTG